MFNNKRLLAFLVFALGALQSARAQEALAQTQAQPQQSNNNNTTTTSRRLYTYAGPLLPSDWSLVTIHNERALIGFTNGSARNAPLEELTEKDRNFLLRLQNGTAISTPLASAREKLAQWSSQVSSTFSKFGKSAREQLDSFINNNNNNNKNKDQNNGTTIIVN